MRPHAVMGSLMLTGPMTTLLILLASVPQLSIINSLKLLRLFIATHRAIWTWNVVALIPFVTSQVLVIIVQLLTILYEIVNNPHLYYWYHCGLLINSCNISVTQCEWSHFIITLLLLLLLLTHLLLCCQLLKYWFHYCMKIDNDTLINILYKIYLNSS